MKQHNKILLISFLTLFSIASVHALPVDLTKNWLITKGFVQTDPTNLKDWKQLDSLPLASILSELNFAEDELRKITMVKTIILSSSDFEDTLDDAFSLHIPYISNVYEIYVNEVKSHLVGKLMGIIFRKVDTAGIFLLG